MGSSFLLPPFPGPEIPIIQKRAILVRNLYLGRGDFRVLGCYSFAYHALREMTRTTASCSYLHAGKLLSNVGIGHLFGSRHGGARVSNKQQCRGVMQSCWLIVALALEKVVIEYSTSPDRNSADVHWLGKPGLQVLKRAR